MKLREADLLRVYAIVSILIWHCFVCPATCWQCLDNQSLSSIISIFGRGFMPEANMPLFTCLSGYVFAFLFYSKKKSYTSFKFILSNKVHRLLIPFLVIGSICTLAVPSRPFLKGMFWGNGSSLWFCAMLFWCTLFRAGVLLVNNKYLKWSALAISLAFIVFFKSNYSCPYLVFGIIPIGFWCFSRAIYFYAYFVLGDILYQNREKILNLNWLKVILLAILYIGLYFASLKITKHFIGFVSVPYIVLLLWLALRIDQYVRVTNWGGAKLHKISGFVL